MEKKKYDSTVARMAGNILSGEWPKHIAVGGEDAVIELAIKIARKAVAELERTEPDGKV